MLFRSRFSFSDGLLGRILIESEGRARRIVTNIDRCVEWARGVGTTSIDETCDLPLYTGRSPVRRRVA